jgi:hypothetical protein
MAEKLEAFPVRHNGSRRPGKYPWDEWLDGSVWQLKRGEDFDILPKSMLQMARTNASHRRLSVRTHHNGDIVVIQASRRTDA